MAGVRYWIEPVTAGIYLGWLAPEISTAQMRRHGRAVSEFVVFLLNAVLFVLVGSS
jgi:NhaP-type Na+/H+ or K+/H+ antiporter